MIELEYQILRTSSGQYRLIFLFFDNSYFSEVGKNFSRLVIYVSDGWIISVCDIADW